MDRSNISKITYYSPISNGYSDKRVIFLDYLRIYAFSSVLIGHKFYGDIDSYVSKLSYDNIQYYIFSFLMPLFYAGGSGVIVFFLISGYIITKILNHERPFEFAIKRLFRIYPLYIVCLILFYILSDTEKFPGFYVFLIQCSLLGDFFLVPHVLGNVEWTLRVEIIFYFVMFCLRLFGFYDKHKNFFLLVLVSSSCLLQFFAPIPGPAFWNAGYFSAYWNFLIIGVMFYIYETGYLALKHKIILDFFFFSMFIIVILRFQEAWLYNFYYVFAFIIFLLGWHLNKYLFYSKWIKFFSDLTFPIYLLHNWLFDHLLMVQIKVFFWIGIFHHVIYIKFMCLIELLIISYFCLKLVERPMIQYGKIVACKVLNDKNISHEK